MAYNPPTSRSKYGDTDFSDDTDAPTGGNMSMPPMRPPPPPMSGMNYQLGETPMSNLSPQHPSVNYNQAQGLPSPGYLTRTITQEDLLFTRAWRQDLIFYRILPFNIVSGGALYYYRHSNGLPQKWRHYFGLSIGSTMLAYYSFLGELKRRVAESNLNTPFMQGMRQMLRLKPLNDDFQGGGDGVGYRGPGSADQGYSQWATSNSSKGDFTSGQSIGYRDAYPQAPPSSFDRPVVEPSYQPLVGEDQVKQGTSYEELRAKNRDYVR